MSDLSGNLIVTMTFAIPVNEKMYPILQREGIVRAEDIVAAEEDNYLANVDNYLDLVGDYVTEVQFSFEEGPRRLNEQRDVYGEGSL
jgi:hypothetical protein